MQFQLTLSLDNAGAVDAGADLVVPQYLGRVAERVSLGYTDGNVLDGNGNTIGEWKITDQG